MTASRRKAVTVCNEDDFIMKLESNSWIANLISSVQNWFYFKTKIRIEKTKTITQEQKTNKKNPNKNT